MMKEEIMKTSFWNEKRVLITGGTSGLGLALARALTARRARVAVVARHRPAETVGLFIQGDVADKTQIHRIFAEAETELGGVDVLVNNASSLGPTPLKLLMDTDCEDLEAVLETNLVGPFRLSKLALGQMILRGAGVVVNVSSDAAVSAYPRWGAYGISKAALDHLTRIFQAELEGTGVRLLALDPGDMDTPLHLAAIPDADRSALHAPSDSAERILKLIENGEFSPVRRGVR
jgi:NAD(P)-dependent dehydrogenase (short-subunit alcohol dehydrogenase family)